MLQHVDNFSCGRFFLWSNTAPCSALLCSALHSLLGHLLSRRSLWSTDLLKGATSLCTRGQLFDGSSSALPLLPLPRFSFSCCRICSCCCASCCSCYCSCSFSYFLVYAAHFVGISGIALKPMPNWSCGHIENMLKVILNIEFNIVLRYIIVYAICKTHTVFGII